MFMQHTVLLRALLLAAGAVAFPAHAQVVIGDKSPRLTIEGFANVTAGRQFQGDDSFAGKKDDARIDAGLRLLGQINVGNNNGIFGVRVEANASPEDHLQAGERSILYSDKWGRIEIGRRQGLPDTLAGYAPNNYTFTSAEFGVASGRRLDPGSTLTTAFLPPALAARIDAVSGGGFTSALFNDISPKVIYVSPKTAGFQAGFSFSPDADDAGIRYKQLLQGGLTHETYWEQNVFRVGGSVSHANTESGGSPGDPAGSLNSLSLGASATLDDALTLGANVTYNNSGLRQVPGPSSPSGAHGYSTSINYNTGPWTIGGYYQWARAGTGFDNTGRDQLRTAQVGASYRLTTKIRFYGAYYAYQLRNEGGPGGEAFSGGVFLIGTRVAL